MMRLAAIALLLAGLTGSAQATYRSRGRGGSTPVVRSGNRLGYRSGPSGLSRFHALPRAITRSVAPGARVYFGGTVKLDRGSSVPSSG